MLAEGPGPIAGKRIVLTGASRGIGRACALRLARGGAVVLAVAREAGALTSLAKEGKHLAGQIFEYSCDVTKPERMAHLAEVTKMRLGRVDVLVNNAGGAVFNEIGTLSPEDFDATLAVCLKAPYLVTRSLVPLMEGMGGDVINISSISAVDGFPGAAAYCAAKAGLEGMSRALVEELRPKGIRVIVLRLGATATSMWESIPGNYDMGKMIPPEVVAESLEYLLIHSRKAWCETLVLYPPDEKV